MRREDIVRSLRQFKKVNKKKYQIVKIGFFGSAARDAMNGESDIDVVVELTEPDLLKLADIKQELEERLHCSVDIVRYRDRMNPFLKSRIDQEAAYV
jgi:uncharacterized protein